jgi:transitional endoplasmic reticulum ATPase
MVVNINRELQDELQVFQGDAVLLKGKKRRETVCICVPSDDIPRTTIRMSRAVRDNLSCKLGDIITLLPAKDMKFGQHVLIAVFKDSVEGFEGDLYETFIKPYFLEAYRPVYEGDVFTCRAAMRAVDFKIMKTFFFLISVFFIFLFIYFLSA